MMFTRSRLKGSACVFAVLWMVAPLDGRAMSKSPPRKNDLITGNTLMVSNRFGPTLIYFDEHGRFRQYGEQGKSGDGIWRSTDDSVCVTVTSLPPGRPPQEHCLELKGKQLERTWTSEDPRNGTITYKLLKGHPKLRDIKK